MTSETTAPTTTPTTPTRQRRNNSTSSRKRRVDHTSRVTEHYNNNDVKREFFFYRCRRHRRCHQRTLILFGVKALLILILLQFTIIIFYHHHQDHSYYYPTIPAASLSKTTQQELQQQQQQQQQQQYHDQENYPRQPKHNLALAAAEEEDDNDNPIMFMDPLDEKYHLWKNHQPKQLQKKNTMVDRSSNISLSSSSSSSTPQQQRHPYTIRNQDNANNNNNNNNNSNYPLVIPPFIVQQPRRVEYLGILIDAGRHYFELSWLYRLVDFLPTVGFNMIHFRLSDDQAFAIQFDCCREQFEKNRPQYYYKTNSNNNNHHHNSSSSSSPQASQLFYTPDQLRQWVAYAKTRGIVIIPELNVPGHAGGFGRDWIVPCPKFICRTGYGIPLNVRPSEHNNNNNNNNKLSQLLESLIREILDIFDNPPFLHLGGDEVTMSIPCLEEAELIIGEEEEGGGEDDNNNNVLKDNNYFDHFEKVLLPDVLRSVNYPESQVLRWEMGHGSKKDINRHNHPNNNNQNKSENESGVRSSLPSSTSTRKRTGGMVHYWEGPAKQPIRSNRTHHRNNSSRHRPPPYFTSRGLYFDTNKFDWAWDIYQHTLQLLDEDLHDSRPLGIVIGTFELNSTFWHHRSVLPRLVAVALGVFASSSPLSSSSRTTTTTTTAAAAAVFPALHGAYDDNLLARRFYRQYYRPACLQVGLDRATCWQNGRILRDTQYEERWKAMWIEWKSDVCHRLTGPMAMIDSR